MSKVIINLSMIKCTIEDDSPSPVGDELTDESGVRVVFIFFKLFGIIIIGCELTTIELANMATHAIIEFNSFICAACIWVIKEIVIILLDEELIFVVAVVVRLEVENKLFCDWFKLFDDVNDVDGELKFNDWLSLSILLEIVSANRLRCISLLLISGLVRMISINCFVYIRNSSLWFTKASDMKPTQNMTSLFKLLLPPNRPPLLLLFILLLLFEFVVVVLLVLELLFVFKLLLFINRFSRLLLLWVELLVDFEFVINCWLDEFNCCSIELVGKKLVELFKFVKNKSVSVK